MPAYLGCWPRGALGWEVFVGGCCGGWMADRTEWAQMASIEVDADRASELEELHRRWSSHELSRALTISGYIRGDHSPGKMTYHQLEPRFLGFLQQHEIPFRDL